MGQQQFCILDDVQLAYTSQGVGEPLLLVHGITTYSFIWQKILPLLRDAFQLVTVDLLGCGASDKPLDRSYSLTEHARRLAAFIEALGLENPHLVGHDLGGGIAQIMAVRHQEKLTSLTLINSVGHNFWPVQPIRILRTPIIRQLLMGITDQRLFRAIISRGFYHKERLTEELLEQFWKPFRDPAGRKAFLHFAKCLDNRNLVELEADLRHLSIPVLILRGDADPFLTAEIAEKLHADIADSRLCRIASAGHYLMEDAPEWTAEQIRSFLRKQDA